ncbi:PilW family protein [Massilia sp. S19_KUP03_FR1]|uniref:PilW family protein n=1 Tax=Massilia sp. S19_KUP03_FR1 TaxID=3025503 RepID=UPI002FCDAA28
MKRNFPVPRRVRSHAGGFSVVELMVSVVIGLLALMFATRMITGGEKTKQAALGGSDAMQNGMLAMFSITGDVAQSGFGLNDPLLAGCDTTMADKGGDGYHLAPSKRGTVTITPLSPVIIESNGEKPDVISLYSGASVTGTPSVRLRMPFTGGTSVAIAGEPYGFADNDVIVIAPEQAGTKCSLVQLSEKPLPGAPNPVLRFESGGGRRFNSGAAVNNFPLQSRVFNIGPAKNLTFHTWSVKDGFLQLSATDLAGSEKAGSTVADNIVSIKAQYGFDTRTEAKFLPQDGIKVNVWSSTMIDADGNGEAGSPVDFQRIAAVRVAVVARSKAPERPEPGQACAATPNQIEVFKTKQSDDTYTSVKLDVAVVGDTTGWKCYRYRTFETIVPVRNSAWRPTAWDK